jgi:type I restriction enzyme R subunit
VARGPDPRVLTNILENYAQIVETKDEKTGKKRRSQVWPRYHQLDVVRRLLADAGEHGAGKRYLIQHSAGSGKSNSIAWLAHQLIGLERGRIKRRGGLRLDHRGHGPAHPRQADPRHHQAVRPGRGDPGARRALGDLRRFIEGGKKIIISTVQKFPFILDEIGNEQRGRRFAIIIDEAHSSQGGRASAAMAQALAAGRHLMRRSEDETWRRQINRLMESRKLLPNASYFAFTATPKNKTLEIFGEPEPAGRRQGPAPRRSTATR